MQLSLAFDGIASVQYALELAHLVFVLQNVIHIRHLAALSQRHLAAGVRARHGSRASRFVAVAFMHWRGHRDVPTDSRLTARIATLGLLEQ